MAFVVFGLLEYSLVNILNRIDKLKNNKVHTGEEQSPIKSNGPLTDTQRETSTAKKCDKTARLLFPTLFAIFNLVYWSSFYKS